MQVEHRQWLQMMYPNQPADIPAAGLVEEAGELLHAILKMEERRIWGPSSRHGDLEAKLADAIGDCAIYACSLCNAMGWTYNTTDSTGYYGTPLELAVLLVRQAAETYENRTLKMLSTYIGLVKSISEKYNLNFDLTVATTWSSVKERSRCV